MNKNNIDPIIQTAAKNAAYILKLENALDQIAQSPFPLEDYCSKEVWGFVCELMAYKREKES